MPSLPRPYFPKPTGMHHVGTVSCTLTDMSRPAHLLSADAGRCLFVRLWYPAEKTGGEPERLWADLKDAPDLPLPMRWLLAYLRRVETSSRRDAPYALDAAPRSLIVYSHGLISFAAENTSLMEELASHGYIVMALQHLDQLEELQALNRGQSQETRKADRAMAAKLKAADPAERASLARAYYEGAQNTNRIAAARAADIACALDRPGEILVHIPGLGAAAVPRDVCLVGFSIGGSASTEFVHIDARARAVANIDGGLFGTHIGRPIGVPYLMFYSAVNAGGNDALLPDHARRVTPPHTAHLNFHDIGMLLPVLRLFGITGRANARDVISHRNVEVLTFLASVH